MPDDEVTNEFLLPITTSQFLLAYIAEPMTCFVLNNQPRRFSMPITANILNPNGGTFESD